MDLREAVFQALGQASMCWDPIPAGAFDSVQAARIGDELLRRIGEMRPEQPPEAARAEISNVSAVTSTSWQPSVHSSRSRPVFGFAKEEPPCSASSQS